MPPVTILSDDVLDLLGGKKNFPNAGAGSDVRRFLRFRLRRGAVGSFSKKFAIREDAIEAALRLRNRSASRRAGRGRPTKPSIVSYGPASSPNMTEAESDRLYRLARLARRAEDVFGSREKAGRWLGKPCRALDGAAPLRLAATDAGAEAAEAVLDRIEYGIFS